MFHENQCKLPDVGNSPMYTEAQYLRLNIHMLMITLTGQDTVM